MSAVARCTRDGVDTMGHVKVGLTFGLDAWCCIDDGRRCFNGGGAEGLPATTKQKGAVDQSVKWSVATPHHTHVIVYQDSYQLTHPGLSDVSSSPIRPCRTPTHVSSIPSTSPIASSRMRFCAFARASPVFPAFRRIAMSRRVIWL